MNQFAKLLIVFIFALITMDKTATAQKHNQMVRLAKVEIDSLQVDKYNVALKEQMETAVKVEPGVLSYYAVADKSNPSHITIVEVYADTAAYKKHIETPHFKKYKATVEHMVKSLQLNDVEIIGISRKKGM